MIEQIIITSLFTSGLYISTHEPYLLSFLRKWLVKLLGGTIHFNPADESIDYVVTGWQWYIWKPLIGCLPCMSSVWGIVLYVWFNQLSFESLYELPIIIISSSCINYFVKKIIGDKL